MSRKAPESIYVSCRSSGKNGDAVGLDRDDGSNIFLSASRVEFVEVFCYYVIRQEMHVFFDKRPWRPSFGLFPLLTPSEFLQFIQLFFVNSWPGNRCVTLLDFSKNLTGFR